jgi:putative salt-induced outer membrane protein YdiY
VRSRHLAAALTIAAAAGVGAQTAKPKPSYAADAGFVSASGNTQLTTLNVDDKIIYPADRWTFTQLGAYVYGTTKKLPTANQLLVAGRGDYAFAPRLAAFVGASFERNTFAGFDHRTNEIAGLSWKAIMAHSDSLSIDAGGVLTQETDVDRTHTSFPAARLAEAYKHSFTKSAYFQQLAEYLPSFQGSHEYRVNTESDLVAPLSAHVAIKIGYVVRFDSKPPATFGTTDRLLTTGVQVSY